MAYTSKCGPVFTGYKRTPYMYVGNTYNVLNSPYAITLLSMDCESGVMPPDYSDTIRVYKNGVAIGDKTCYPFIDDPASCPTLFDGGNICISGWMMNCQDTNNCQYDIWYKEDPCTGVTCSDTCFGADLWIMKCDPLTGACVQDVLKQANSPICSGSHYIEYDFSFLPQSFLNLIASNIVDLSNWLGTHLPIPSNIQWKGAIYSGGRFRIYVIYTPPLQSPVVMSLEQFPSLISLPAMALSSFAGLIAGLIVFAVAQRLTSVLGPLYSTIIGAALGIVGGLTLSYTIYEFSSGTSSPGTAPPQTSVDKSKNIAEYIKNYVKPFCDQQYPGCATVPATCDQATYRVYAACVQQVAQCQYDAVLKGDPITTCDPRVQEYKTIDTGLGDGTMTVAEAQQRTTTNNTTINNYHDYVVQTMTCPSGQTYDPITQKCVQTSGDCWIAGITPGSCILTASTGKTITIIGGVIIGGYLIFRLIKK